MDHCHEHPDGGHDHTHHAHGLVAERQRDSRALAIAFLITTAFLLVEALGGWLTGSLALLADAGHMFTDSSALALSLAANWLARQPALRQRTYGLYRAEILAALANGLALFIICGFIFYEAWQRLQHPEPVRGGWMLAIAVLGLVANAVTFLVLWKTGSENLNLKGALLHVFGDMLGSLGAIGAGLAITLFGWNEADPIISVVIALLVLLSAWHLIHETLRVLLEIAPAHIQPAQVTAALKNIPGVAEVHDVHVWTIASGLEVVSGHLLLTDEKLDAERMETVLKNSYAALQAFKLEHITLQIEPHGHAHPPCKF